MAQRNWTYLSDEGRTYHVGIFHGPNTGHLLIFCNLKVLLVDFSVLESKSYSFFLGEELCEISLESKDNYFQYNFNVNRDADTPHNRKIKARDRKHWLQTLAFFGLLVLCATVFSSLFIANSHHDNAPVLLASAIDSSSYSIAKVFYERKGDDLDLKYEFVAHSNVYRNKIVVNEQVFKKNLPLENGDEFIVYYDHYSPDRNYIDFSRPSEKQIEKYQERAIHQYSKYNIDISPYIAECMVKAAYQIGGISALADFYFQHSSPEENPTHNQQSYLRLIRSNEFNRAHVAACW